MHFTVSAEVTLARNALLGSTSTRIVTGHTDPARYTRLMFHPQNIHPLRPVLGPDSGIYGFWTAVAHTSTLAP